jgi:diguanylate cyclase (GGDEF)-like protein
MQSESVGTRARVQRWGWLAVLAAGALLTGLFYVLPTGSIEQSWMYNAIGVAVVAAALVAVVIHRPKGAWAWVLMALGQLAFVLGDIIWTIFTILGEEPYPSIADVSYIAGYPLISLGLVLAIRSRISGGDRAGLLDAAILTTGAGILWWAVVLGPLTALADPSPIPFAVSVAYPLGDLLLIGMALALAVTPGAKGASFRLLVGSLVAMLAADLVFNVMTVAEAYEAGGWLDSVWLAAYILFAASAAHRSMADLVDPRPVTVTLLGPVRILLLGVAMLVGPALLMSERSATDTVLAVVAVATAALSVLVLARLAAMVRHLGRDIERRKALEAQLAFQAFHDPLTGLANRRRFIAAVNDALRAPGQLAALFLDLDDFKDVNDNQGHDAGDALLLAVGERLMAAVRPDDLVGRLGGDEFAVLLTNVDSVASAETVAARLVDALAGPIEIEGRPLVVSASVGLTLHAGTEDIGCDDLLRRADVAMYHAKARGKNRWMTYRPEMDAEATPASPLVRRPAPAA